MARVADADHGLGGVGGAVLHNLWGYIVAQALGVVADLGVAAAIGDASAVTIDGSRRRLALSEARCIGRCERSPAWATSQRPHLAHLGTPRCHCSCVRARLGRCGTSLVGTRVSRLRAWSEFGATVRSGSPAFDRVFGAQLFDYLSEHDERRETFNRGMAGLAASRLKVLLAEDWSDVRRLVDVGGGRGVLVAAMLARNPEMHGIVFDLPAAADEAIRHLSGCDVEGRWEIRSETSSPASLAVPTSTCCRRSCTTGATTNVLRILHACREAIPQHGRLVLLEGVVPSGDEPSYTKLLDLQMLVMLTGRGAHGSGVA